MTLLPILAGAANPQITSLVGTQITRLPQIDLKTDLINSLDQTLVELINIDELGVGRLTLNMTLAGVMRVST